MQGWYYSLKEALSQIRLTIKQILSRSNRNPVNQTPVPCRKNTAIRLHYGLPDEDGDRDWHTEGDQGMQEWTIKEDYSCPHLLGKLYCGMWCVGWTFRHCQFLFYGSTRQGNEKRSPDQCAGLGDCHRAVGNSGSTVFKSNIPISLTRAKRPTIVVMNFKKAKLHKNEGVLLKRS